MATRTNFPDRIKKRQDEAKLRQEASDKLTLDQKIAKANPGSKEYVRLSKKKEIK